MNGIPSVEAFFIGIFVNLQGLRSSCNLVFIFKLLCYYLCDFAMDVI